MVTDHQPDGFLTLEELRAAYAAGVITEAMTLDNDVTFVYHSLDGNEDNAEKVFEMHPEDLLRKALELLGIPWESV